MKEMFPDCNVVWTNVVLTQETRDENDNEFWVVCKRQIELAMAHQNDYWDTPDYVFASEDYGHRLAETVGATFVPVDISRSCREVSGTKIRTEPFKYWEYLPDPVKPYFTKRVVLFGPESSGKSTLGKKLAWGFCTPYVPEYGRTYTETFGSEGLTTEDLKRIIAGHKASVAAAKRQANRILIEDTDPLMTTVWNKMLLQSNDGLEPFDDFGDLYILTGIDIPWEDDGTRYFPADEDRKRFYQLCKDTLEEHNLPYVEVCGGKRNRYNIAYKAIQRHLF